MKLVNVIPREGVESEERGEGRGRDGYRAVIPREGVESNYLVILRP